MIRLVVVLLLTIAVLRAMYVLTRPYDVTLAEGLRRIDALVVETAAVAAPGQPITSAPDNVPIDVAERLHDNHSFFHQGVFGQPGLNDCDSWRNIIHDGWQASYGVTVPLNHDPDATLIAVRRHLEREGFTVSSTGHLPRDADFKADLDFAMLYVAVDQTVLAMWAGTGCLPAG